MSTAPIESNDWSDRYRFRQFLAQGGMGVVYLAEDKERDNTLCVIKQLILRPTESYEHSDAIRLFEREAAVLKSLNHPGIVRLLDNHFTADGHYFLVMDYVPGKTLDHLIRRQGVFSSQATVEIGMQCCEILEYLHSRTPPIIYRDLKPSNIMLTPEGQVVLIDFGIARSFMPNGQTVTRIVTTGYSPPEQYFGKPEFRSDLYSLGATLGHLLTDVKPKPLLSSSPKKINSAVLSSLDQLIRRLTAHDVEDRPLSAQFVRHELYHIYHEIDPEFLIPAEAKLIDWKRQEVRDAQIQSPEQKDLFTKLISAIKSFWYGLLKNY